MNTNEVLDTMTKLTNDCIEQKLTPIVFISANEKGEFMFSNMCGLPVHDIVNLLTQVAADLKTTNRLAEKAAKKEKRLANAKEGVIKQLPANGSN